MITFGGLSFNWFIALIIFIGLIYAIRAGIGFFNVSRDARFDYDYKFTQGMIDKRLSKDDYIGIYKRVHNPRRETYIAITIFSIFLITPITMVVFEYVYNFIYNITGQSRVIEPGFLVWQFFIFFFIIVNCAAIAYFYARHYHRNAPGSFQSELERKLKS